MKFLCGVDDSNCTGTETPLSFGISGAKTHSSSEDAFRCKTKSLIKRGYTQVGSREFQEPNNGAILVLTKVSRFGARLRRGKEGSRSMPRRGSGVIVG